MSNIYKFYPSIGLQNINLKKLNDNFEMLCSDIISLKVEESSTITSGSKGLIYIPCNLTIVGWVVGAYTTSSLVIDVKKCTAQSYPVTTSITGGNKIIISNSQYGENNVLSSWDPQLLGNSWIEFFFDSVTGTNKVDIILKVTR